MPTRYPIFYNRALCNTHGNFSIRNIKPENNSRTFCYWICFSFSALNASWDWVDCTIPGCFFFMEVVNFSQLAALWSEKIRSGPRVWDTGMDLRRSRLQKKKRQRLGGLQTNLSTDFASNTHHWNASINGRRLCQSVLIPSDRASQNRLAYHLTCISSW